METCNSLVDFDVIFPLQSSEFINSLNFGSNLKKTEKKYKFFTFHLIMNFYHQKNIFFQMK